MAVVVALLIPAFVGFSAWRTWSGVERVDLGGVLAGSATGTNYLVVGTDSRAGVPDDVDNAGVIFGSEGERTDTIAILRIDGDQVDLLAIPRDLWVTVDGREQRINAALVVDFESNRTKPLICFAWACSKPRKSWRNSKLNEMFVYTR